jgi:hypothetical protein
MQSWAFSFLYRKVAIDATEVPPLINTSLHHSRQYRNTHLACVEVGMHLICEHPNEHHKVHKELATRNGTATPIPAPEDLAKSPHERPSTSK